MFIPLEIVDSSIVQQVGTGAGWTAVIIVAIREYFNFKDKRKIQQAIRNGNGRGNKVPDNPGHGRKYDGTSTTNMMLGMIHDTDELMEKVDDRLRKVEIGLASLQATCKATLHRLGDKGGE